MSANVETRLLLLIGKIMQKADRISRQKMQYYYNKLQCSKLASLWHTLRESLKDSLLH